MGPVPAISADARHTLRSWRRSRKGSVDLSLEQPLSLPPRALLCGAYSRLGGGGMRAEDEAGRRWGPGPVPSAPGEPREESRAGDGAAGLPGEWGQVTVGMACAGALWGAHLGDGPPG